MGGFIPAPLIPANGPRTSPPSRTATHGARYAVCTAYRPALGEPTRPVDGPCVPLREAGAVSPG